ncbi:MAG TPA: MgtC/SapB family protein [Anaerolineaceae bacterium]|jgi:putative Mg2+ transporter-C (MgtC) family protein|nr:MgtC/SapB family protein [Anaerolineaceae bacterium]HNZ14952.1 MgtC/SapB family protein [Anaerolineaceae bacterium]HQL92480.1 MgtC/SapB family protein [Anaerolineaceae bacterium]
MTLTTPVLDILLRLGLALILGGVVGFERERDSQPAGLRTHMILVLGACLAAIISEEMGARFGSDPTRLAAQVISGIGFLGAGAILRFGFNIKGLTTATTLWTMAIVGLAVGFGYYLLGALTTVFMIIILTIMNVIEKKFVRINLIRNIVVDVDYQDGIIRTVRKAISNIAEKVVSFSVRKSVRSSRLRLTIVAQFRRSESVEDLVELLSKIEGLRSIKIDQ